MGYRLYIYDAQSGKLRVSEGSFLTLGADNSNTFHVRMKARIGGTFACKGSVCRFFPHGTLAEYSINGTYLKRDSAIPTGEISLMLISGGCLLCWYGDAEEVPDFSVLNSQNWYTYDMAAKAWSKPLKLSDLCGMEESLAPDTLVTFEGLNNLAFLAKDIMEASRYALEREQSGQDAEVGAAPSEDGPRMLTCPHCWELFLPEETLSIASHPKLRGDDILGPDAMRRFPPKHYTPEGVPLDAEGYPCKGTACPHCHSKLPQFLAETHQHIISIIGAPYSGKTYLLTTMVNEAFKEFPRDFGVSFRDSDPKLNAPFNQLRQQFFGAEDPVQAYLKSTELGDDTTHDVWKKQVMHNLPAPISFGVSRQGAHSCSLIFYDTPGYSFIPGQMDQNAIMAAAHVQRASAHFFLFDPTLSRSFRQLIKDSDDPQMQLELAYTNLQTQMLSELEMQLRDELNQPPPHKLHIPVAVVLVKSDAWLHLLGPEPLLPVVRHGRLQTACVRSNSNRLRRLLFSIAPQVCATAESFSDNVCYFAVSALGGHPITFQDEETGGTYIGPASGAVTPSHITDPLLWAINAVEPDLLPHNN